MNAEVVELDLRTFEPPQPLLKSLEAITTLPERATLQIHTRWRPALLYAELEKRGFVGESQEQPDGSCITQIRRA
jgi:tRNA 2-thiouridine synthesizing protein A